MVPLGALALLSGQVRTESTQSALTLEVHLVMPCESDDASAPMQLARTSKTYCLRRSGVVDQTDVASAAFDQDGYDKSTIKLILKGDAAQRVEDVTRKSIGNSVGVVVNGQLVSVAMIAGTTGQVWIGGLPRNEAESVIQAFQRGQAAKTSPPALPSGGRDSIQHDAQGVYRVGNGVSAPSIIRKQEPEYTPRARAAKIQGTVLLEVVILPDGTPDNMKILHSVDPDLDAKAIECTRSWRFRPALKDGKPVPVRIMIEVNFHL